MTEIKPAAFFLRQGDDTFVPTPATVGPWDAALQHGGPSAALLGRAFESLGGRSDVRVSYFSLDFLGPLQLAPMTVRVEVARPGKRIELATAMAIISGRPALRAAAWRLSFGADRSPRVGLEDPPPRFPEQESTELFEGVPTFGYGKSLEWRFASGGFRVRGPATVWSRMRIPLVLGEAPSPLVRLLTMVDSANGVGWEVDFRTYMFVPVNLTVSITRSPQGEWVGMHAITALASDGVGTTRARLFDAQGYVGEALQTLFVNRREP
jgi:acyl-CoA thioesterase